MLQKRLKLKPEPKNKAETPFLFSFSHSPCQLIAKFTLGLS